MTKRRLYPIGLQDFAEIRQKGGFYVDKTDYVYQMTHTLGKYYFLSRPRRFGKSLFVSTLKYYFEGRRELFEGLAIDRLEEEWLRYPVLHFDLSMGKHCDTDALYRYLMNLLKENEKKFGIVADEIDTNIRLANLIKAVCEKEQRQVVVLIDEYDSPLLDVVHEDEDLPALRRVMRNFYSPLKACDPYLRFVFMTGITKFSQLSIFSELNNIRNISMLPDYAAICGITKEELSEQMAEDIDCLAERLKLSHDEALARLCDNYDGYHFTWPSPDIFNPYSLLNALADGRLDSYWFGSGTPTYLIEMLRKFNVLPTEIGGLNCRKESFDAPTERMGNATPLLYQSGYLTIKGYNNISDSYLLDIPNKEVRVGLMDSLIINYVQQPTQVRNLVAEMYERLYYEDLDGALRLMQKVLSTIPYCDNCNTEGHYQQLLFLIFTLMGYYSIDVEVRTPTGRVDVAMKTQTHLYIIELKLNRSAGEAIRQIELRDYSERFALCGLPIVKVGINFDTNRRTLSDWQIVEGEAL